MKNENTFFKYPSNCVGTLIATKNDLIASPMSDQAKLILGADYQSIDLTSTQHRILFAIFQLYSERGLSNEVIKNGVEFSLYEICKHMHYKQYGRNSIPGKCREEVMRGLLDLSAKKYPALHTQRYDAKLKKAFVIVIPNQSVLEMKLCYVGDTFMEAEQTIRDFKPARVWVKVCPHLVSSTYFRQMDWNFYERMKTDAGVARLQPHHWLYYYWLARSSHVIRKASLEELLHILKLNLSSTDPARQRKLISTLHAQYKKAGYISKFEVDQRDHKTPMKRNDVIYKNPNFFP